MALLELLAHQHPDAQSGHAALNILPVLEIWLYKIEWIYSDTSTGMEEGG